MKARAAPANQIQIDLTGCHDEKCEFALFRLGRRSVSRSGSDLQADLHAMQLKRKTTRDLVVASRRRWFIVFCGQLFAQGCQR